MGFLVVFLIPGIVILSVAAGAMSGYPNLAIWAPWFVGYVIVPFVQIRWPREPVQTAPKRASSPAWTAYYRVLPLLALPAQLAMLAVTTAAFVSGRYDFAGLIVLTLTTGIFSAMFAVNIAHELIHRRERLDRVLGGLLLSTEASARSRSCTCRSIIPMWARRSTSQRHAEDRPSTFWLRSLAGNFGEAIRRERMRLRRSGRPVWQSELVPWSACSLLWPRRIGAVVGLAGRALLPDAEPDRHPVPRRDQLPAALRADASAGQQEAGPSPCRITIRGRLRCSSTICCCSTSRVTLIIIRSPSSRTIS